MSGIFAMPRKKTFYWPSRECIGAYSKWLPIVLATFFIVYFTSNFYAASQSEHYHMYANWELAIPLVPPMIVVYMTYVLVFLVILFVLKTPEAIRGLAYSMLITIGVSGIIFVAFPGYLGYGRPAIIPGYEFLFKLLYAIDQPYNLYPSLHVAFAALCVLSMIQQTNNERFHLLLKVWFVLVCCSVILVHQHHFFDIGLAMLLAWGVYKTIYLKTVTKQALAQEESMSEVTF